MLKIVVNCRMARVYKFGEYLIKTVVMPLETNFIVYNREGYVCRIVPRFWGFDLSPLDYCLDNIVSKELVSTIVDHIINQDA